MTTFTRPRSAIVLLSILTAFAASLWLAFGGLGCDACGQAKAVIGNVNLGVIGALYYAVLLGFLLRAGYRTRLLQAMTLAAMGVHLVLVVILWMLHIGCVGCLIAAASVFIAGGAIIADPEFSLDRHFLVFPATAAAALIAFTVNQRIVAAAHQKRVDSLMAELRSNEAPANGMVKLIVYTRPGCRFCRELETKTLPGVLRGMQDKVTLEPSRKAPDGLPAPVIVILGKHDRAFPSLPSLSRLKQAIAEAL